MDTIAKEPKTFGVICRVRGTDYRVGGPFYSRYACKRWIKRHHPQGEITDWNNVRQLEDFYTAKTEGLRTDIRGTGTVSGRMVSKTTNLTEVPKRANSQGFTESSPRFKHYTPKD